MCGLSLLPLHSHVITCFGLANIMYCEMKSVRISEQHSVNKHF